MKDTICVTQREESRMSMENGVTEVHEDELSAQSLIEEVSIDGMCGVY